VIYAGQASQTEVCATSSIMEAAAKAVKNLFWGGAPTSRRRFTSILLALLISRKYRQVAGEPPQGCKRSYFVASSPFSFIISSVISAAAYMSFTSSHSLTV